MHSSAFVVALLAASAVASPIQRARDLFTDLVVVTDIVTVTADSYEDYYTRIPIATVVVPPPSPEVVTISLPATTEAAAPADASPTDPAPAPAPSSPAAPAPTPDSSAPTGNYANDAVNAHNVNRAKHSANPVTWDADLANIAAQIASTCNWGHDTTTGGGGYGQNIAAGDPASAISDIISTSWYGKEEPLYPGYSGEPDMGNFEAWGHFSQVVWASTTTIGCATQSCPNGVSGLGSDIGPYFTVCNYKCAGNVEGSFAQNVLAPK